MCIHDGMRTHTEKTGPHGSELSVHCDECGALLWGWERLAHEIKPRVFISDDVYELLYTRKGRLTLVKEALIARGWPTPELWEERDAS